MKSGPGADHQADKKGSARRPQPAADSRVPEALDLRKVAWFLDIDGTLLEIAPTPGDVTVPPDLVELLLNLQRRADGALALISGRSLEQIDALFGPHVFSAAGLHGFESRDITRQTVRPALQRAALDDARGVLARLVAQKPGLVLEDKEHALALHYRLAPALEEDARVAVEAIARRLHPLFTVQGGKSVWELKPAGYSKGEAIEAFMQETPFAGRMPIFIGDDVTDEGGFAFVNQLGGHSIKVVDLAAGTPTAAQWLIPTVQGVIEWLQSIANRP